MPAKGVNTKKESGRAKKAENEEKKKQSAAAVKEKLEEEKWSQGAKGGKSKKDDKEEKRKAELARKAENARMLEEEEASAPSKVKTAPKASGGAKKGAATATMSQAKKKKEDERPAGPGALAAGGLRDSDPNVNQVAETFSATGIDDALDLMTEVINAKSDKAGMGSAAAGLERHPERRFKAALEAYTERELPKAKEEHPGLRLNQYKELLYKQFQKSPENPFNQVTVDYNASKEEKVEALKNKRGAIEDRLREKS